MFFLAVTIIGTASSAFAQIKFIENKGQWESNVLFRADIGGTIIFIGKNEINYLQYDKQMVNLIHDKAIANDTTVKMHNLKVEFKNALNPTSVQGINSYSERYHYFLGNDPSRWASNVKAYQKVYLTNVYHGIDFEIFENNGSLKYNFIVQPGANLDQISLIYHGAEKIEIENGSLLIQTSLGYLRELSPVVYQETEGKNIQIPASYNLNANQITFELNGKFRKKIPLVIDPVLVFSTYSGSTADNFGYTATYDNLGNGYAGGTVFGIGFPTTTGAFQMTFAGGVSERPAIGYIARDAGILKFSSDGTTLLYATYIGGGHNEQPHSLVVNSNNELIVFGTTRSANFPIPPAVASYDRTHNGNADIFVCKLSQDGSQLLSSTFIGGSANDGLNGDRVTTNQQSLPLLNNYADDFRGEVIVDANDNILFASTTMSSDFPLLNSLNTNIGLAQDACVVMLSPDLGTLLWSTVFGGVSDDAAYSLSIGSNNDLYVTGGTASSQFLTTGSSIGHKTNYSGGVADGFLLRFNLNNWTNLSYTYIGTNSYDQSYFVQTDKHGFPYVYGQTSGNFPISNGVYSNPGSGQFICKYSVTLEQQVFSTVFGASKGIADISPTAFLVDECDRIFISGWGGQTNSSFNGGNTNNMPLTNDAIQKTTDGSDFYLAVFGKNMTSLSYASYFGGITGSGQNQIAQEHVDGGTSRFDKKGIVYHSVCSGCSGNSLFPTTPGVWSNKNKSSNCNNALFKIDFETFNKKPIVRDTFLRVMATESLQFTYSGTDPDAGDSLFFEFTGDAINGTAFALPHISINWLPGVGSVSANFSWNTNCNHYSGDTIYIKVKIKDKGCPSSDSSFATIKILVEDPPPANLPEILCINFNADGSILVNWPSFSPNQYFNSFALYRKNPDNSTTLLDTFYNGNAGSFKDNGVNNPKETNYCYFVRSFNKCGKPNSNAYEICTNDEFESPVTATYMHSVTVIENKNLRIKWFKSNEPDFLSYNLYRAINDGPNPVFELYRTISGVNDTVFIDIDVKVNEISYCYKIEVSDNCGHTSAASNKGCSIVLKGSAQPFQFTLDWNFYAVWAGDVNHYTLYRSVDTGSLRPITTTSPVELFYIDKDLDYWWGGYFYKIIAYEGIDPKGNGYGAFSESNTIYLIQPPLLHVPTAFSPNGDRHNPTWGYVPVFVKDFNMRVFTRWGEKVFDSDYKGSDWDGSYRNLNSEETVFVWIATYTGWDGKVYQQKGSVTILK